MWSVGWRRATPPPRGATHVLWRAGHGARGRPHAPALCLASSPRVPTERGRGQGWHECVPASPTRLDHPSSARAAAAVPGLASTARRRACDGTMQTPLLVALSPIGASQPAHGQATAPLRTSARHRAMRPTAGPQGGSARADSALRGPRGTMLLPRVAGAKFGSAVAPRSDGAAYGRIARAYRTSTIGTRA